MWRCIAGKPELVQRERAKIMWTVERVYLMKEKDYTICNPGMRSIGAWLWLAGIPSIET